MRSQLRMIFRDQWKRVKTNFETKSLGNNILKGLGFLFFSEFRADNPQKNNINVIAVKLEDKKVDALSAFSEDKGAFIVINDRDRYPED